MAGRRRSRGLLIQQSGAALDQLKFEAAQELGITIPQDGYYGNMVSREAGSLGGYITKRLVQQAEASLAGNAGTQGSAGRFI